MRTKAPSESGALQLAFTIASASNCSPRPQPCHLPCRIHPRHKPDYSFPDICLHTRLTFPPDPEPSSRVVFCLLLHPFGQGKRSFCGLLILDATSPPELLPGQPPPIPVSLGHRPHFGSPLWILSLVSAWCWCRPSARLDGIETHASCWWPTCPMGSLLGHVLCLRLAEVLVERGLSQRLCVLVAASVRLLLEST